MKFNYIHLLNYRLHASLKVDFQSGFNVIVGINGSGKTSVLNAICDALTGFCNFLSIPSFQPFMNTPNVARLLGVVQNSRYRFEPQYPVQVNAMAEAFNHESVCVWTVQKLSQLDNYSITGIPPGQVWMQKQQALVSQMAGAQAFFTLPVIAFYRANRYWNQSQPNEMQAATVRIARTDGYACWWDASLDSSALQSWVISKCLERFQTASESGAAFDQIESDELAIVNQALRLVIEGISGLKYDLKQKSLLVEWEKCEETEQQPTAFENLSDGQRAVIGLVADIARRMCVLNPHLGQDVTSKTPGVVLIDELDMHLHPRWQRILTTGLKRAFPEVQFIVASHSPQVLGELHPEEIILLRPGGTEHPQVSYGLTSSQVLEEIMGVGARAPQVQNMLTAAFEFLERDEISAAKEKLSELEGIAAGIPELAGARALVRRKEVLGK